jgi:predicted transcriptional regulator
MSYKSSLDRNIQYRSYRRDRIDIIFEILHVINTGEMKKTRIMYAANLDWRNFKRHMGYLVENKLISENGDSTYILTKRGKSLLEKLTELKRFFDSDYPASEKYL